MCWAPDKEVSAGFSLVGFTKACWKVGDARPAVAPDLSLWGWEWLSEAWSLKSWELLRGGGGKREDKGQDDNLKHLQEHSPEVFTVFQTGDCRMAPWPAPACRCVLFGLLST